MVAGRAAVRFLCGGRCDGRSDEAAAGCGAHAGGAPEGGPSACAAGGHPALRLLAAAVRAVDELGCADTTVADITSRVAGFAAHVLRAVRRSRSVPGRGAGGRLGLIAAELAAAES